MDRRDWNRKAVGYCRLVATEIDACHTSRMALANIAIKGHMLFDPLGPSCIDVTHLAQAMLGDLGQMFGDVAFGAVGSEVSWK